jgi:ABC-2 type transport system ATP-binding protein
LLDEPLTGLDPASMAALRAVLLDALRRGTALAMVTHQREDVEALATHVAVVRQGAVEVTGTVQECHEALLQHWEPPSVRLRATTVTPKSLAGDQGADP